MTIESNVRCDVDFGSIPFLDGAIAHATAGVVPGGSRRNLAWGADVLDAGDHDEVHQLLFADAQTSGGLVFGIDPTSTDDVLAELASTGHTAARIGTTASTSGAAQIILR